MKFVLHKKLLNLVSYAAFMLFFSSIILMGCQSTNKECHGWNSVNFNQIEKSLLTSPVKKIIPLHKYLKQPKRKIIPGINKMPINRSIFILFLEDNIKAIFKPERKFESSVKSAYMAYRLSQFMNLKLVPPTVIRTVNGKTGITQLFIDSWTGKQIDPVKNLTDLEKSTIYIFNFILGEHNPHPGNLLFGEKCKQPALVDNESAFWPAVFKYNDYPFVSYTKTMEHIYQDRSFINLKEFPENEVISIATDDLSNSHISQDKKDLIKRHFSWFYGPEELIGKTLFFVDDWKGAFWIKTNFRAYTYIYKQFLPSIVPKTVIKTLKRLNRKNLSLIIFPHNVRGDIISEMLFRRDVILNNILRCSSKFKYFVCQNSALETKKRHSSTE